MDKLGCEQVCLVNKQELYLSSIPSLKSTDLSPLDPSKSTSHLICDIGSTLTTIYPVYENFIISEGIMSSSIGGEVATKNMRKIISKKIDSEEYLLQNYDTQMNIARVVKETQCRVYTIDSVTRQQQLQFNMLSKNEMDIFKEISNSLSNEERERPAEIFFNTENVTEDAAIPLSITDLLEEVQHTLEAGLRQPICSTIVLTGKTSLMDGFVERLQNELAKRNFLGGQFVIIPFEAIYCGHDYYSIGASAKTVVTFEKNKHKNIFTHENVDVNVNANVDTAVKSFTESEIVDIKSFLYTNDRRNSDDEFL